MPASVQETLTNINLPTIAHLPNSPDLALYAFHLFPNLKRGILGNGYHDAKEMTRDVKFKLQEMAKKWALVMCTKHGCNVGKMHRQSRKMFGEGLSTYMCIVNYII